MENGYKVSCTINNGIFSDPPSDNKMGLSCDIISGNDNKMGTVNLSYKMVDGKNKVDINLSKNLVGKLMSELMNTSNLLDSLGKIFSF